MRDPVCACGHGRYQHVIGSGCWKGSCTCAAFYDQQREGTDMDAYQDSGPSLSHLLSIDHRDGRHDEYPDARCPLCAEWTS